ncbi:MAG: molybdenum cofactor guanylyltransferase MobA [bacterium]
MISGAILAGGYSKRFGSNKAFVEIKGKPLIERIIDIFIPIFDDIFIVSNSSEEYEFTGYPVVNDVLPIKGPLVGIYSALHASKYKYTFICACDMPFISPALIKYMIKKKEGYDIIVPGLKEGQLEPLHAIYSKSCIPFIKDKISIHEKKIISFYRDLSVYILKKDEIIPYDPQLLSFYNINTDEDFRKSQQFL